jgi:hypothetical protein
MKTPWFKRFGWFHLPVSLPGWVAALMAVAFVVHTFIAIDRQPHSVSDTLYGMFPFVTGTFLLMDRLAGRTSGIN